MFLKLISNAWHAFALDNKPQPEYKKISELNAYSYSIKEMDGAGSTQKIFSDLKNIVAWGDSIKDVNKSLTPEELQAKRRILTEARAEYNLRFYLMIGGIIANAAIMTFAMYSIALSQLSYLIKPCLMLPIFGLLIEGTIHGYKGKRDMVGRERITHIEIEAIDNVIQEKNNYRPK